MTSTLSFGITVQNWMRILKTVVSSSTKKSVRIRDIIVSARLFREQIRKEAAQ